ncbi:MAG: hypothetical protein ACRDNL_07790 [Spirillospora sp.]
MSKNIRSADPFQRMTKHGGLPCRDDFVAKTLTIRARAVDIYPLGYPFGRHRKAISFLSALSVSAVFTELLNLWL